LAAAESESLPVATLNNLGSLYYASGRYAEAEQMFLRAIEQEPSDQTDRAAALVNLAALYRVQARYNEAAPLYENAVALTDEDHRPGFLCKAALLARDTNDLPRAEHLVGQALDTLRRRTARDTEQAAACLTVSGGLAMQLRPAEARRDLEQALKIREHVFGARSPQVADTLVTLGLAHRLQGRYKEAEQSYRRALAIQRAQAPTLELGITLHNLAQLLAKKGGTKEALEFFHEAIQTWERLASPDYPGLAIARGQAGVVAYRARRYDEAAALLERADTAEALLNLGAVYLKQKQLDKSARAYQRAVGLLEKRWGAEDERLAKPLDELAAILRQAEEYGEAAEVELRATRIRTVNALR